VKDRPVDREWTRVQSSLLAWCAWLIWFFFPPTSLPLSFAQEPPSFPRERQGIPSQNRHGEAGPDRVDPALGADDSTPGLEDEKAVRRGGLLQTFGLQPLTTEEEDKAKHLSDIAARMGTDPTAIIGRAQTLFRYDALEGGKRTNNLVARLDAPYHGNFLFRADLPYVWSNPNQPGTSNQDGVSDLFVRAGGRVYADPTNALFAGIDFTFPTADKQLGSGKYTVGPGVATAHVFPEVRSLFFTLLQHQVSVGGDPSRRAISVSNIQAFFNTIWTDRWWTRVEAMTQLDWERKATNSMTLEFEGGHRFPNNWGVWVRPGVGLWGRNVPGAYEWNIEVGIRRMFAEF
jgi:hypothetical protein